MPRNEAYVRAIDNLEKAINMMKKTHMLEQLDEATLSYDIFILKMMPYYTGQEGKPREPV